MTDKVEALEDPTDGKMEATFPEGVEIEEEFPDPPQDPDLVVESDEEDEENE